MPKNTPPARPIAEFSGRIYLPAFTPTMQSVVGMGGVFNITALKPVQDVVAQSVWYQVGMIVGAIAIGFLLAVGAGRRGWPWLPTAFAAVVGAARWGIEGHPAQAVALLIVVVVTLISRRVLSWQPAG